MSQHRVTTITTTGYGPSASVVQFLMQRSPSPSMMYQEPNYQDASGNTYSVSSGLWSDEEIGWVTDPDVLSYTPIPEGVGPEILETVAEAQASFRLVQYDPEVTLDPSKEKILSVIHDDPLVVLGDLGLTPIIEEEE